MIRSALVLLIAAASLPASQNQTLRVDVQLSQIVVTVTDGRGHLIPDLAANDFIVEVDGVRQSIAHFSQDAETPISLGLLLDMSGSMLPRLQAVKQTGSAFIRGMRADDEYFLMTFADSAKVVQELTHDREKLVDALSGLKGGQGSTRLLSSVIKAGDILHKSHNKKRAVVVITDGVDTECGFDEAEFQKKLVNSEVIAYGIRIPPDVVRSRGSTIPPLFRRPNNRCASSPGANRFFEMLASETGGRSFTARPDTRTFELDLDMIFDHISSELRGQYTIGIYPTNTGVPGGGVIRVRTKNPDYNVRARRQIVTPGRN
jgi:Ca-activated chloride channel homolog